MVRFLAGCLKCMFESLTCNMFLPVARRFWCLSAQLLVPCRRGSRRGSLCGSLCGSGRLARYSVCLACMAINVHESRRCAEIFCLSATLVYIHRFVGRVRAQRFCPRSAAGSYVTLQAGCGRVGLVIIPSFVRAGLCAWDGPCHRGFVLFQKLRNARRIAASRRKGAMVFLRFCVAAKSRAWHGARRQRFRALSVARV